MTDGSQYFILLIISDGVITDMAQTKESIVNVRYHITLKLLSTSKASFIKTGDFVLPRHFQEHLTKGMHSIIDFNNMSTFIHLIYWKVVKDPCRCSYD